MSEHVYVIDNTTSIVDLRHMNNVRENSQRNRVYELIDDPTALRGEGNSPVTLYHAKFVRRGIWVVVMGIMPIKQLYELAERFVTPCYIVCCSVTGTSRGLFFVRARTKKDACSVVRRLDENYTGAYALSKEEYMKQFKAEKEEWEELEGGNVTLPVNTAVQLAKYI